MSDNPLRKIDIEGVDLHDSQLISLSVDYLDGNISLVVRCYLNDKERNRAEIYLSFSGVTEFSTSADVPSLKKNFSPGNVNYWAFIHNNGRKKVYIYLVNGYLEISYYNVSINNID